MIGIDESVYLEKTYSLSALDKLDWADKIELQMWLCIRMQGIYGIYHNEVKKLESCVATDFSGLDFKKPIMKNIANLDMIKLKKTYDFIKSFGNNIFYKPKTIDDLTCKDKDILVHILYEWYWTERFNYVRDLFAYHRGLLWGKKHIPGGKPMGD